MNVLEATRSTITAASSRLHPGLEHATGRLIRRISYHCARFWSSVAAVCNNGGHDHQLSIQSSGGLRDLIICGVLCTCSASWSGEATRHAHRMQLAAQVKSLIRNPTPLDRTTTRVALIVQDGYLPKQPSSVASSDMSGCRVLFGVEALFQQTLERQQSASEYTRSSTSHSR